MVNHHTLQHHKEILAASGSLPISTCFTSRLYGAHTVMPLMQEMRAFTLITGKISEESLILSSMKENSALNGRQKISFKHMPMAAKMNIDVASLMDGKSKSIIQ